MNIRQALKMIIDRRNKIENLIIVWTEKGNPDINTWHTSITEGPLVYFHDVLPCHKTGKPEGRYFFEGG